MTGTMTNITRGLAALCLVGTALWVAALARFEPKLERKPPGARAEAQSGMISLNPLPQAAVTERHKAILQRPLFHWTRQPLPERPVVPTPTEVAAAAPPPPVFVLRGVMLLSQKRTAILQREGSDAYVRLAEGEQLDGWEMRKVESARAELEFQGRAVVLDLAPADKTP